MLTNLDHLRAEHAEILTIAGEIEHLLDPDTVKQKAILLAELVNHLTRRTLAHLLLEDRCLYQEMLSSEHDETREMAQQYIVRMGNIAENLKDYICAWPDSERIASSVDTFCKETRYLLETLETRIDHEETALYPKAEMVS